MNLLGKVQKARSQNAAPRSDSVWGNDVSQMDDMAIANESLSCSRGRRDGRDGKDTSIVFGVVTWLFLAFSWVFMTHSGWPGLWDGFRIAQLQIFGGLFLAITATVILPRFWRIGGFNSTLPTQFLRVLCAAIVFVMLSLGLALGINSRDVVKIAFGWDEFRGGQVLQSSARVIEIRGPLSAGIANNFRHQLKQQQEMNTALLNSEGGWVDEGHRIGRLISHFGLNTHSSVECSSACTVAFIHGLRRTLSPDAHLGFHSASGEGTDPFYIELANEVITRRLVEIGVSREFIERAVSTPPSQMWYPPYDVLFREGIVHEIIQVLDQ